MRAELLTIGSELLSGATINTNAAELARRLAEVGLACRRQTAVGDERPALLQALREALARCDVLVTSGGLGPTFDDITLETIAEAAGRPLTYRAAVGRVIRRFYTRRHRRLQQAALRQAFLPHGAVPLPNPIGTAPGIWLPLPRTLVIALPGVPREMRAMLEASVLPRLRRLRGLAAVATRTLRTVGTVELSIEAVLRRLRIPETVQVGLYPHLRAVDVRLTATAGSRRAAYQALTRLETSLRRRLGPVVYGADDETLEGAVGSLLASRRKSLAVAESCTGGLLADRITDVPGSSRYFLGGVVAYHNNVKRGTLGVPADLLERFGAVSAQTATAMADGVRRWAGASVGLAITGVAGPTGGSARKPVGLVYVALSDGRRRRVQRHQFFGDRESIKWQAAQTALDWLRRFLATR